MEKYAFFLIFLISIDCSCSLLPLPQALSVLNYYCLFREYKSHLLSINYKCFSSISEQVVFGDIKPFHLMEIEYWRRGMWLERKFRIRLWRTPVCHASAIGFVLQVKWRPFVSLKQSRKSSYRRDDGAKCGDREISYNVLIII